GIVLALALIVGVVPGQVVRAGDDLIQVNEVTEENDGLVHEVHFEVPEPEAGELPSNNIKLTTVPANAFTSQFVNNLESRAKDSWKKSTGSEEPVAMGSEEAFEAGYYYTTDIASVWAVTYIVAAISGTLYNTDVAKDMAPGFKVFINGEDATNTESSRFQCKYDLKQCKIKMEGNGVWEYTGEPIKPEPDVSLDGKELTLGTDYTLSYSNNKFPGKATINVEGIGLYKGSETIDFEIELKEMISIDKIEAETSIPITPVAGANMENPTFSITVGMPVEYNSGGTINWERKDGDSWVPCYWGDKFTCGTYRLESMFGLYGGENKVCTIPKGFSLTVNGEKWKTDNYMDMGTYGCFIATSPEFVIEHDWGDWKVSVPATETKDGIEIRVCKNDPTHTETRIIPKSNPAETAAPSSTPNPTETAAPSTTSAPGSTAAPSTVSKPVAPASAQISEKQTKVTEIKANAFKNNKKLKKITIGKDIKKIGKNAFYGCKNLKKIIIKTTKLTKKSVGKNAFAKINAKAKIKVPKKKLKAYKKILKARGVKGKKQKIKA
nr:leucine-rich repeat protein [Eubacterium sp.]